MLQRLKPRKKQKQHSFTYTRWKKTISISYQSPHYGSQPNYAYTTRVAELSGFHNAKVIYYFDFFFQFQPNCVDRPGSSRTHTIPKEFGWELKLPKPFSSIWTTGKALDFTMCFCISLSYLSTRKRAVKPRTETHYSSNVNRDFKTPRFRRTSTTPCFSIFFHIFPCFSHIW